MEVSFKNFIDTLNFCVLVNFPVALDTLSIEDNVAYVCKKKIQVKDVYQYLDCTNDVKIKQVLEMVHLVLHDGEYSVLECQKLELAKVLLHLSEVIVLEYFFEDLIFSEREYFKRLFRNLLYKKGVSIILIEKDMNFICETVKKIYLFTKNFKYQCIDDFYDDSIYLYVEMPYTVELVKYLESKGHVIDHDFTFLETLKSIYRGVS